MIAFVVGNYENPVNWTKTFSRYDKNPYGSNALAELAPDLFPNHSLKTTNDTYYEILTGHDSLSNTLSISESFYLEKASLDQLLSRVNNGATAFISAQYLDYAISDTLGFALDYDNTPVYMPGQTSDSSLVYFPGQDTAYFNRSELMVSLDSLEDSIQVFMKNEFDNPVMASFQFGQGQIIINTTPILFTNFYMMYEDNNEMIARMLSTMPDDDTIWTEYYQNGRYENQSPFRELLKHPPLKNALHLSLALVLLYLIFESKRAQRAIPVIKSLPNMTLDFVKTVGNLYQHNHQHHAAAVNKINYFREFVRTKYGIRIQWNESKILIAKTGLGAELINDLFTKMEWIEQSKKIEAQALIALDQQLNKFYLHTRHHN